MTDARAEQLTESLLTHFGLDGWTVIVVESFPENPQATGGCRLSTKTIGLKSPAERSPIHVFNTITHELTHALDPTLLHGSRFAHAHFQVQQLALEYLGLSSPHEL